jgi:hypothetical protein
LDNKDNRNKAYVSKEDTITLKKIAPTRRVWSCCKTATPKSAKINRSSYTGRNEEIGRSRNRWEDKVKEGFNVMGIMNSQEMARASREWRKFVLEAKVHNGL